MFKQSKPTNYTLLFNANKLFIPHLNGSRSTQVSRLLHTSVEYAPHLCGANAIYTIDYKHITEPYFVNIFETSKRLVSNRCGKPLPILGQ